MQTDYHRIWQCLYDIVPTSTEGSNSDTLSMRFFLNDAEAPIISFPNSVKPVVVVIDTEGQLLCENVAGLSITAPFFSQKHQLDTVIAVSTFSQRLYWIAVHLNDNNAVTEFASLLESFPLGDTPYGSILEVLGLSHFNSISRSTNTVNDEIALYVKTLQMDSLKVTGNKLTIKNASQIFAPVATHWKRVIPWFGDWTHTWCGPFEKGTLFTASDSNKVYQTIKASGEDPFPVYKLDSPKDYAIAESFTGDWMGGNTSLEWFRRLWSYFEITVVDKRNRPMQALIKEEETIWTGDLDEDTVSTWDEATDTISIEFVRELSKTVIPTFTRRYTTNQIILGMDSNTNTPNPNLPVYGVTIRQQTKQLGSEANLCLIVMKDDFAFDGDRDLIVPLSIRGPSNADYKPTPSDFFPRGLAIMYPFAYVLSYKYVQAPQTPLIAESTPIELKNSNLKGLGWQMCLDRIDLIGGHSVEQIIIKSNDFFRFNYGIPAIHTDWQKARRIDQDSIGEYAKYRYSLDPEYSDAYAVSDAIPQKDTGEYPTIAGLASVSANLFTVHNGSHQPWLLNPVTGYLETAGFSLYPFTFPSNQNIDTKNELLYTVFTFQDGGFYGSYPFMHLCIGDGLPSSPWSTSIDIQDVSTGEVLTRRAKVRNNLLRDMMTEVTLSVPSAEDLPYSEMLWLSLNPAAFGETPGPTEQVWFKSITFPAGIYPCESTDFWIKIEPLEAELPEAPAEGEVGEMVKDPITLYFNASFNRKTIFHGYRTKLSEAIIGH